MSAATGYLSKRTTFSCLVFGWEGSCIQGKGNELFIDNLSILAREWFTHCIAATYFGVRWGVFFGWKYGLSNEA
jgi:hypothetical protein